MSPLYRRIGPYEIRREIGSGGMADVFVAEDVRTGAEVALKVPRRDADICRAEREGARLQRALAECDRRVAQVFEIGEDDGVSYVAMEYVAGEDLSERLTRGPLDAREAVRIALELCDLLATAHATVPVPDLQGPMRRGIVHGDLKPRNVRIEPSGRVRVVDFGIAKALSETRTRTRNEFGSLPYSSPERIDTGQVDGRSDMWSVAVVLYEMLTGKPPFQAATPRELEERIRRGPGPAPLPAGCPRALDIVIHKALQPEIARRYSSARTFGDDLRAAIDNRETLAESEDLARAAAAAANGRGSASANGVRDLPALDDASTLDEATRRTGIGTAGAAQGRGAAVADETHRTASAPEAGTIDDSTRRTGAAPEAGAAPAPAPSGPASGPPLAPVPARTPGRIRRIVKRVLIVAAIVLVLNEVQVFRSSQALAEKLPRYGRSDVATVWANYQKLRNRSVLKLPTLPLAFRVERWLIGGADDITADYLSDTPTIREGGWREAAALLRRALEIAPGNGAARARLRYCEGHLARIDAEAMRERRAPEANGRFNTARRAFEDAARLRRGWPDPYLGLARVQAVGFGEVDRTRDALDRARRAGYQLGDRETAVEADAYATRADRTWRAVPGLPDEERYLERILDDCARSLELYESVPAYGTVRNAIKRVHALRDKVEMRLAALIAGSAVPETGAPGAAGQTPRP